MNSVRNVQDYFKYWKYVRESWYNILEYVKDEDLDWVIDEGFHKLGNILNHASKTYYWWLGILYRGHGAPTMPKGKPRTVEGFKEQFKTAHAELEKFLSTIDWSRLDDVYEVNLEGEQLHVPLWWILWRMFEHEVHHRAQVKMYLKKLGRNLPEKEFWNIPDEFKRR